MKKLVTLGFVILLSACPVACINDPTQSNELPTSWETSTETVTETSVEVSTDVDTDTETSTSTELSQATIKLFLDKLEASGI